MSDILTLIKDRRSVRAPFDFAHPVAMQDIQQILEAARWSPTAHNMQNFEIVVVEDKELLKKLGEVKSPPSEVFIRENFEQLSFSEEELLKKKVGILGTMFPPVWRTSGADFTEVARNSEPSFLKDTMKGCPLVMIVIYDARQKSACL